MTTNLASETRMRPANLIDTRTRLAAGRPQLTAPGIQVYASTLVPGPLQVYGYRAAVRSYPLARECGHFEADLPSGIPAAFVLEESVLHHQIGGPDIMSAQVRHVIQLLSADSGISVTVIPLHSARTARQLPMEPFVIINGHKVVLPVAPVPIRIDRRDVVHRYSTAFFRLRQAALTGSVAHEYLTRRLTAAAPAANERDEEATRAVATYSEPEHVNCAGKDRTA
ncbi:Scr1 family TA system antitoxin-like transcriptional regulator [Streptomyces bluensis]|uniref:Scr1 family TA system antitoxin-like transcriptional regulator n=1 Tax=Streptomyces bluensis TaxID=33897 RepID=A0ABW6UAK0_9ACTN